MRKKRFLIVALVAGVMLVIGLAGCGKKTANKSSSRSTEATPVGVYKTSSKDGQQYWYLAPYGQLDYYSPADQVKPGNALSGTWKKTHDQQYQFKLRKSNGDQSANLNASVKGNRVTIDVKTSSDLITWKTATGAKQVTTSKAEFMKMFNKAKASAQKAQQSSARQQSVSSSSASANSTDVHLTGGQSSIDYITQKMGDQGWTVESGTYGGAHGAPTDGSYIPYNTVRNDKGDMYQVFQDGRIQPFGN